jgi:hypothetical protein
MTGYEKKRREFLDEFSDLFGSGVSLLGGTDELSLDQVKILRAFLAEGYYSFNEKHAATKSKRPVGEWMADLAFRSGVNQSFALTMGRRPLSETGSRPVGDSHRRKKMNFGEALEKCKAGARIQRSGWNGKNQYVFLIPDYTFKSEEVPALIDDPRDEISFWGCFCIMTTNGKVQMGWLANAYSNSATYFCDVIDNGTATISDASAVGGCSPAFRVADQRR